MPRLLLPLIAAIFLLSAGAKTYHGVPSNTGGDLYAAFVHNQAWKHYSFLAVEFGLGFWLLSGKKRNLSALATMFLLATLTTLLLAEFFLSGAPKVCGCFANLLAERREEAKTALMWSTARNLAMIVALTFALWKMTPSRPAVSSSALDPA